MAEGKEDLSKLTSDEVMIKIYQELKGLKIELKNENQETRDLLNNKIGAVQEEQLCTKKKLAVHDGKLKGIEIEKRKKNVIIYGIKEEPNETRNETKLKIDQILNTKMKLKIKIEEIDDFFRMGKKDRPNRPIMLKLVTYWRKNEILKNGKELKGTGIHMAEDLSKEEEEEKRKLVPIMKEFRNKNCHAIIRRATLIVNGKIWNKNTDSSEEIMMSDETDSENELDTTIKNQELHGSVQERAAKINITLNTNNGNNTANNKDKNLKRPLSPDYLKNNSRIAKTINRKKKTIIDQGTLERFMKLKVPFQSSTPENPNVKETTTAGFSGNNSNT
uniref:Uncharacterized protein n=2 Tax=Cacopsylla melanoneura TaxID=428564 RepID=A0A8D9FI16_9HEMI